MKKLYCFVYTSTAVSRFGRAELDALLEVARGRNAALGLTGLLLYANGRFMQYLEGPHDQLAEVVEAIKRDPRHGGLKELAFEPIDMREFADWRMAFFSPGVQAFATLSRARWFVRQKENELNVPDSDGRELLRQFWREHSGKGLAELGWS